MTRHAPLHLSRFADFGWTLGCTLGRTLGRTLGWCGLFGLAACAGAGDSDSGGGTSTATTANESSSGDAPSAGETSTGHGEASGSDGGESTAGKVGCGDMLAQGASVRDVSFFQVIEVATLSGHVAVPQEERTAALVANRAAVARVRVDTEAGWTPRTLGVRISVTTPEGETSADAERVVAQSDASGLEDGFVVDVPAAALLPGATYAVSLVECEPGLAEGGASADARYPATGEDTLDVVRTGPIKLHLVPYEIGGFVPDTSQEILDGFREAVLAVYPTTEVLITVGETVPDQDGGVVDMGDLLVRLGQQQEQQDQAPPDVYYYGLVTGAENRDAFCDSCPTGTSESGGGGRAGFSVGAAFADQQSEDTLIHELGHMHGLLHAPCGGPDLLDEAFPYGDAALGVEGYDMRTSTFVAPDQKDLMAYCYPRWVSDYHYRKMIDWVQLAQSWGAGGAPQPDAPGRFVCP